MSPAAISASVTWLPPDSVNQDRRADGVVSLPEIFPVVCVGQVLPPFSSVKTVDHKHAIGPRAQLEGDNRLEQEDER